MQEINMQGLEAIVGGVNVNYRSHVVRDGEDAVKIGNYYGVAWQTMLTGNRQRIRNPILKRGDVVLVPVNGKKE